MPNVRSFCQVPTGMKPACLFLLLAFSVKAKTIWKFYLHACMCVCVCACARSHAYVHACAFFSWKWQNKVLALLIYSVFNRHVLHLSNPHTLETVSQNNDLKKKDCCLIFVITIKIKSRDDF